MLLDHAPTAGPCKAPGGGILHGEPKAPPVQPLRTHHSEVRARRARESALEL